MTAKELIDILKYLKPETEIKIDVDCGGFIMKTQGVECPYGELFATITCSTLGDEVDR